MARSGPAPHATRNPGRQVQLSRRRPGMSKAHRATQALKLAGPRKKRREFEEEIDEEFTRRADALQRILTAHNKKLAYVRGILSRISQFKATRTPSLHHALVHQRSLDAQADGAETSAGRTTSLKELKQGLKDDIESGDFGMDSIDAAEEKRLINQALDHRMNKRRGVRGTTKASQIDVTQTMRGMTDAMGDLNFRTGTRGFAVFSRGNADDPTRPHIIDSDDSMSFLMEVYGISPVDFLRSFEGYCVTRDEGIFEKDDVDSVRKSVSRLLTGGLRRVKNSTTITMEYVHYDTAIREAKGVELAGWPADVPISRPATWNKETGRRIRDMLHSGAIHWVTMTRTQHAALIEENNTKRAALGAGALRRWAERSDKGLPRGPRRKKGKSVEEIPEEEDEEVPATPAQTKSTAPPAVGTSVGAAVQSHAVEYSAAQQQPAPTFPSLRYDPVQPITTAPTPLDPDILIPPYNYDDLDAINLLMDDIAANGLFPDANALSQQAFASGSFTPSFDFTASWNQLPDTSFAVVASTPASPAGGPVVPIQVLAVSSRVNVGQQKRVRDGTEEEEDPADAPPRKQRKRRKDAGVSRKAGTGKVTNEAPLEAPVKTRKKRSDAGVSRKNQNAADTARDT
ncbi:hypothetical protein C8F04DRAFT_1176515 [Mycena alexandri]|uniref:Uncharacterized protein n=1 Tax=Mycena alexandri TaxID=1745969 RepID=A0AAD6T9Q3_9AGAR|nr:hypothetical protein C8F04DRAFT_1185298 [Mycena alexandri]KAJ7042361.1 hypothetical protein C8F04DRAFT_1176515 [Mycena alexandri]